MTHFYPTGQTVALAEMPAPAVRKCELPHAERMALRRAEQLNRVPGFTAMPNKRVERMAAEALERQAALGFEGLALEQAALRDVASRLPALTFARRHRAPRPSKSDTAAYRKCGEGWAD